MSITAPTDPWTRDDDDDVPMRPGSAAGAAAAAPPRHVIEQTALVYLKLSADGTHWCVDTTSVDGYPLDSAYDDHSAQRCECPCGQEAACEAARAAADRLPLPTGRELAALIINALG